MEDVKNYYKFDGHFYFVLFDNKCNFSARELTYIFSTWGNVIFVEKINARSNYYYVKYKYEDEVQRCVIGLQENPKIRLNPFSRSHMRPKKRDKNEPGKFDPFPKCKVKATKKDMNEPCVFKPRRVWDDPNVRPSCSKDPPPVFLSPPISESEYSEYPLTESSEKLSSALKQSDESPEGAEKKLQAENKTFQPSSVLSPPRRKSKRTKKKGSVQFSPETKGMPLEAAKKDSPGKKKSPIQDVWQVPMASVHGSSASLASTYSHTSTFSPSVDVKFYIGSSPDASTSSVSERLAAKDPLPDPKVINDPSSSFDPLPTDDPPVKPASDGAPDAKIATNQLASSDTLYSASDASLNPLSRRNIPDLVFLNEGGKPVGITAIFNPATREVVITKQPVSQMKIPPLAFHADTGDRIITKQPVSQMTLPEPISKTEKKPLSPDSDDITDDDTKSEYHPIPPEEGPSLIRAECMVVFNIPAQCSQYSILHLFHNFYPLCVTPIRIVNSSGLRYCVIYFQSFFQCIAIEHMYDDIIIIDDHVLSILRPETVLYALSVKKSSYI